MPAAEADGCDRGYSVHGLLNFPRAHGRTDIFLHTASSDFRNDFTMYRYVLRGTVIRLAARVRTHPRVESFTTYSSNHLNCGIT